MRINIQSARFYASSTLHHLCGCCKNPYTCAGFFVFVGWLINSTRQGSNLRTRCDGVLSPTPLTTRPHVRFWSCLVGWIQTGWLISSTSTRLSYDKFNRIWRYPGHAARRHSVCYVPIWCCILVFSKPENLNCCMDTCHIGGNQTRISCQIEALYR